MTTDRTLPDACPVQISPATGTISAPAPEAHSLAQLAGIQALQAAAVTQPLRAVDAKLLVGDKHTGPIGTHDNGLRPVAHRERKHRKSPKDEKAHFRRRVAAVPWPLLAVLAAQAALSLRLVWSNTAYLDEALYLWAGHLEWAHWLHGKPIPDFPAYFSGAPVSYPPLAALADSIGGLAAARLLSLAFMLGTTALLYGTTRRIYGDTSAFFAVSLFATVGPVLHVGAFATFDPMATFLLAFATWCVARVRPGRNPAPWMLAAAGALTVANLTTYSTMVMDPVVLGFAAVTSVGRKDARVRTGALATYLTAFLVAIGKLAGHSYIRGFERTVLERAASSTPPITVLHDSLAWSWALLLAGAIGVAAAARYGHSLRLAMLLAAPVLVIAAQVHDRTSTSLDKHLALGLWFAAIPAGYALARLAARRSSVLRAGTVAAGCAAITLAAFAGARVSVGLTEWPDAAAFVTALRPFISGTAPILVEASAIAQYYEPEGAQWQRWTNTWSLKTGDSGITSAGNPVLYARAIQAGYFGVIALNFHQTPGLDQKIVTDMEASGRYYLAATVPYGKGVYSIWVRD